MKIGDEVYIYGYVDEIRKDVVIIRNNGGYFGTVPSEVAKYVKSHIYGKQADAIIIDESNCSEKPNNCEDEPMKTADYCDICKRDMCDVCIADATNPYCVPSHYEIRHQPKTEPQTVRCPKCGRTDYIREFGKDFSVTAEEAGFKYKCINCNTYIKTEPQTERSE